YITYRCNNSSRGFCKCGSFSHKTMEKAFLEYLDTLENMAPDKSIMEKRKKIVNSEKKKQEINKKIEKLENKKKVIRNQFINDLIDVNEYHEITEEIQKQQNIQQSKILELDEIIEDSNDSYSYDDIKDIVTNIKLNWGYLTNKEKQ